MTNNQNKWYRLYMLLKHGKWEFAVNLCDQRRSPGRGLTMTSS